MLSSKFTKLYITGKFVVMLNLRDLRDLPISEGDIVGTKRCV